MQGNTIFGKEMKHLNANIAKWNYVPNSTKKLSSEQIAAITRIIVKQSKDSASKYMMLIFGEYYTTFTLDLQCTLNAGDEVDPSTFRIKEYTNGVTTIIRCSGKIL